jgi:signal transduction histidine kinase
VPGSVDAPLVMYVDDEPANRVVFQHNFGGRFRVEVVGSGAEALARIAEETPAVVISDQRMPGMAGTELLARVRELSPDTVRVILTAYSDPGPMLEAINRAGASRYLVKPWSHQEMVAMLDGALATYRLACEVRALQLQLFRVERFAPLGEVTASLAHDMAGPISALVLNMERLGVHAPALGGLAERAAAARVALQRAEHDAVEELPEIARESQDSAGYLASLVGTLRDHARAEPTAGTPARPERVLDLVLPIVRGLVREHGGELVLEREDVPPVRLVTAELARVLVNLVSNAVQALRRERGQRKVTVQVRPEERGVRFVVADTGVGMTPEQLKSAGRVRFTTRGTQGTGMGLTIVRALIEGKGGRFELQSAVGQGTQVSFWLPQAE